MMRSLLFCGLALVLAGTLQAEAAQTSCSAWNATCHQRCHKNFCETCEIAMGRCLKTGCWTEAAPWGGKRHCGLTKS